GLGGRRQGEEGERLLRDAARGVREVEALVQERPVGQSEADLEPVLVPPVAGIERQVAQADPGVVYRRLAPGQGVDVRGLELQGEAARRQVDTEAPAVALAAGGELLLVPPG